jgi:hypothetical protein
MYMVTNQTQYISYNTTQKIYKTKPNTKTQKTLWSCIKKPKINFYKTKAYILPTFTKNDDF